MILSLRPLRLLQIAAPALLAASLHAQMDPGFLGKRHVGASLFIENVNDVDIGAGTGVLGSATLPLRANLDVNGFASTQRFSDFDIRDQRLGATLLAYRELDYFKPFVEAGVAGTWQSSTLSGRTFKNHDGLYLAAVGIEAALGRVTALTAKVGYNQYFDSDNGEYWTYTLGLNTWFNDRIGGQAAIAFNESETTVYSAGLVCRF
jgi:hypothetical protein